MTQDPNAYDTSSTPAYRDTGTQPAVGDTSDTGSTPVTRTPYQPPVKAKGPSHLSSLVLATILTPLGLIALDYSLVKGWGRQLTTLEDGRTATTAIIAMGVGAALLFVVGALARTSGLGPLFAGLLWGAAPTVGFALAPVEMATRMGDLPDPYDQFLLGLISNSIVFPAVGALLIGAGLFGRWRRDKVVTTTA